VAICRCRGLDRYGTEPIPIVLPQVVRLVPRHPHPPSGSAVRGSCGHPLDLDLPGRADSFYILNGARVSHQRGGAREWQANPRRTARRALSARSCWELPADSRQYIAEGLFDVTLREADLLKAVDVGELLRPFLQEHDGAAKA